MGFPMVIIQFSSPKSGQPLYSGQITVAGPNVSFRQRFHRTDFRYSLHTMRYSVIL